MLCHVRVEVGIQEAGEGCSVAAAKPAGDFGSGCAPARDLAGPEPIDQLTDKHPRRATGGASWLRCAVAKCRFVVLSPIDAWSAPKATAPIAP